MQIKKIYNKLERYFSPECIIWISGLLLLALANYKDTHISICPLKNLNFPFCPGCGLGNSIHLLFRLQFEESFRAHPLGAAALGILIYRIIYLIRYNILIKNSINI